MPQVPVEEVQPRKSRNPTILDMPMPITPVGAPPVQPEVKLRRPKMSGPRAHEYS